MMMEVLKSYSEAVAFAMKNRGWIDSRITKGCACEMMFYVTYSGMEEKVLQRVIMI